MDGKYQVLALRWQTTP